MIAIALAAFFGLAGIGYAATHHKPTHVHVLCPGQEAEWEFKAGDSVVYNPPTCRFPLESYHNGPLLFR